MELGIGIGLALVVGLMATVVGLDRDRALYPTILIVSASYYGLFAVMAGELSVLGAELAVLGVFLAAAVIGFRSTLWVVVAALLGHGLFDLGHELLFTNGGVPGWWRMFCLGYDLGAAGYLAWLLTRPRNPSATLSDARQRPGHPTGYYRLL